MIRLIVGDRPGQARVAGEEFDKFDKTLARRADKSGLRELLLLKA